MGKATHVQIAIGTSLAVRLIELGARLQLLEHEFPYLSRETLLDLYKEVRGESPPKGMLPFSEDWFLTWQPNVHASLFIVYYEFFKQRGAEIVPVEILMKAYDFYTQEVSGYKNHDSRRPLFSLTRAWMLIRLMGGINPMLTTACCSRCKGSFVVENHKPPGFYREFVCGICKPPARAGKTGRKKVVEPFV